MPNPNTLQQEIRDHVQHLLEAGVTCHPDFVTREIMINHPMAPGENVDYHWAYSWSFHREAVRKVIGQLKLKPEDALEADRQMSFPGWKRLQIAYVCTVNGEQVAIPLTKMTTAQRNEKIEELGAMAAGCLEHQRELKRFCERYPAADEPVAHVTVAAA